MIHVYKFWPSYSISKFLLVDPHNLFNEKMIILIDDGYCLKILVQLNACTILKFPFRSIILSLAINSFQKSRPLLILLLCPLHFFIVLIFLSPKNAPLIFFLWVKKYPLFIIIKELYKLSRRFSKRCHLDYWCQTM
jgi:hypothetical protein